MPCRARMRPGTTGPRPPSRSPKASRCLSPWRLTDPATASSGPILAYGSNYIGADGKPAPLDDGAKAFIEKFVGWVGDGTHEQGRLGVCSSAQPTAPAPTISSTASSPTTIPAPGRFRTSRPRSARTSTGSRPAALAAPTDCTGMPGGAGLVAVKYTKNPTEVAKVMDLSGTRRHREGILRAHAVPARAQRRGRQRVWISRLTMHRQRQPSNIFVGATGDRFPISPESCPAGSGRTPYYAALVTRVSQVSCRRDAGRPKPTPVSMRTSRPRSRIRAADSEAGGGSKTASPLASHLHVLRSSLQNATAAGNE